VPTPAGGSPSRLAELATDRPDYTEGAAVLGTGILQFEQGLTVESDHGTRTFTGPEFLMRAGINRRFELRFGGDGVTWGRGFSDAEFGARIMMFQHARYLPAVSVIPIVSVPWPSRSLELRL
jgi:hypothetical protein